MANKVDVQESSSYENFVGKKEELEKIIAANEKEEKHYNKQAAEAKQQVDPRLLASYEKIRNSYRNGLAVVPVERDACGGCFNAIPPQRQSEIRFRAGVDRGRGTDGEGGRRGDRGAADLHPPGGI